MKKLLCFLMAVCLLFTASACKENNVYTPPAKKEEDKKSELHYTYCDYINDDTAVVPVTAPDECLYYRELLKKDGLEDVYDAIVYTASHLSDPVEGYDNVSAVYLEKETTEEELIRVYMHVMSDHPEFWFFQQPNFYGCTLDEQNKHCAYLAYSEKIADIPEKNRALKKEITEIITTVTKGITSEEEITATLSGWMCQHCQMSDDDFTERASISMREVVEEGQGTCLANSFALVYFLQQCDITAFMGAGSLGSLPFMSHFWVISVFNDKYCYTDVYYMGQVYNGLEEDPGTYLLMESDELLKKRRDVKPCKGMPICGSEVGSDNVVLDGIEISGETIPKGQEE